MNKIIVNKLCIINQEVQLHRKLSKWDEQTVLANITAVDDSEGFVQFYCTYDPNIQCCETCGDNIKLNGNVSTVDQLFHEEIWNKAIFVKEISIGEIYSPTDSGHGNASVLVKVKLEKHVLEFEFYNIQNGYYAHEVMWDTITKDKLNVKVYDDGGFSI